MEIFLMDRGGLCVIIARYMSQHLGLAMKLYPNKHLVPTLPSSIPTFNQSTYLLVPSLTIIIHLLGLTVYSAPAHMLV